MKKKKIQSAASGIPGQDIHQLSTLMKARVQPKRQTLKSKPPTDDPWIRTTAAKKVSKGADEEME